jgi:hypothetical protein
MIIKGAGSQAKTKRPGHGRRIYMEQPWQPIEIRIVPKVPMPDRLYICMAKIKPKAAVLLRAAFAAGKSLPKNLLALLNGHLALHYNLGQAGSCWEGGPSPDFKEVLYIFAAGSLDEARGLVQGDPFFREGIIFQDVWFGWSVHVPPWKLASRQREEIERLMRDVGVLPAYPPGVTPQIIEKGVDVVTPAKLVVCLSRTDPARIKQIESDQKTGGDVPAYFIEHVNNRLGPGGTTPMGYDWESGPSEDQVYDLTIYAVDSIETARRLRENDRFSRYGLFYDHRFFEWCIFTPFAKASPLYKVALQRFLEGAGVPPGG